jgi:hypothetical protein
MAWTAEQKKACDKAHRESMKEHIASGTATGT